jgi:hypothetical protein
MSAITQLLVPYTCPKGHQSKITFTQEDLRIAIAQGALRCLCDSCGESYTSNLTSDEAQDLQRLLRNASGEQLPKPNSPKAEVWID